MAGFPCQSYSRQRTGRWAPVGVASKSATWLAVEVVASAARLEPRAVLAENAPGFRDSSSRCVLIGGEGPPDMGAASAAARLEAQLEETGKYHVVAFSSNLDRWVMASRPRQWLAACPSEMLRPNATCHPYNLQGLGLPQACLLFAARLPLIGRQPYATSPVQPFAGSPPPCHWSRATGPVPPAAPLSRFFLVAVHTDTGTRENLQRLVTTVRAIEAARGQDPPLPVSFFMHQPRDAGYREVLRQFLTVEGVGRPGRGSALAGEKWRSQAVQLRMQLLTKACTAAHYRSDAWTSPVAAPKPALRGVPASARAVEMLNLAFLDTCASKGFDPTVRQNRDLVARGLFCNVSQNPVRKPWGYKLGTFCSSSMLYSFEHDRCLVVGELLRVMGWGPCNTEGLTPHQVRDLVSESIAQPVLGTVLQALILSIPLPGLWEEQR